MHASCTLLCGHSHFQSMQCRWWHFGVTGTHGGYWCMQALCIQHCLLCFIHCVVWMVANVWFVCRGVICLLKVVDGSVTKGDRVIASSTGEVYDVLEVRSFTVESPPPLPLGLSLQCTEVYKGLRCTRGLCCSQVGYVIKHLSSGLHIRKSKQHFKCTLSEQNNIACSASYQLYLFIIIY